MQCLFLIHMYSRGIYKKTIPMIFKTENAAKLYAKNCIYDCEIEQVPIISEKHMKFVIPLIRCNK